MAASGETDSSSASFVASHLHLLGFDAQHSERGAFQAIIELMDNAKDACAGIEGAGVLATVRESAVPGSVTVTVTDTGKGMTPSEASRLAGGVFISTKQDMQGQVGTYGVGLKGTVLWSLIAGKRRDSRCTSGELMLTSVHGRGDESVTLRVRATEAARGCFSIDVVAEAKRRDARRTLDEAGGAGTFSGSHTTVSLEAPCGSVTALARLLVQYCDAAGLVRSPIPVRVEVHRSGDEPVIRWSSGPAGPADVDRARLALLAGASEGQVFCGSSKQYKDLHVRAAVALQFSDVPAERLEGLHGAEGSEAEAELCATDVGVSLSRVVNGAPLAGGGEGCALAAALAGEWWGQFGMRCVAHRTPARGTADAASFLATPSVLSPVTDQTTSAARKTSLAERAAATGSCSAADEEDAAAMNPGKAEPAMHAFAFRSAKASELSSIRVVVSVAGSLANSSASTACIKFGSFRKRSLLPHPKLEHAVAAALQAAMKRAAARFPKLLRSAASKSSSHIFGGLLPSMATSVCGVLGRMDPALLERASRALRLAGSDVSLSDIRDEVHDRVVRAAQTSVDSAASARSTKRRC